MPCRTPLSRGGAASPESPRILGAWRGLARRRAVVKLIARPLHEIAKKERNYAAMHLTNSRYWLELSCHIEEAIAWGHQHIVLRRPPVHRAKARRTCGREVTKGGAVCAVQGWCSLGSPLSGCSFSFQEDASVSRRRGSHARPSMPRSLTPGRRWSGRRC